MSRAKAIEEFARAVVRCGSVVPESPDAVDRLRHLEAALAVPEQACEYACQVLTDELERLRRKAELERLSASNQSDTVRGQRARARFVSEAERLEALAADVERALAAIGGGE